MYKSCIHRQCCTFRNHVHWYLKPCILIFETMYIDVWKFEIMYNDIWNHVHWYLKPRILMFETTYIDVWNHVHWYLKPRTLIFETTYIDVWNLVYWRLKPQSPWNVYPTLSIESVNSFYWFLSLFFLFKYIAIVML